MTITELANVIRKRRQEIGMTQIELAFKASTTQKSISKIETGKENPSFLTMLSIVKALDMDVVIMDQSEETVHLSTKKG